VYKFEKKSDLFLYNQAGAKQGQSQNRIPNGILFPPTPQGVKKAKESYRLLPFISFVLF